MNLWPYDVYIFASPSTRTGCMTLSIFGAGFNGFEFRVLLLQDWLPYNVITMLFWFPPKLISQIHLKWVKYEFVTMSLHQKTVHGDKKKLDGNHTRMLWAILNKSCRQHPTRHQLYGHLPPVMKTIQVRWTRHTGHCWRSQDELISDVLLWTPAYGQAKAGWPAWTYIQQLCEDTGCSPEDLPEAMNDREKWRERVRDIRASSTTWWWWWLSITVLGYFSSPLFFYIPLSIIVLGYFSDIHNSFILFLFSSIFCTPLSITVLEPVKKI